MNEQHVEAGVNMEIHHRTACKVTWRNHNDNYNNNSNYSIILAYMLIALHQLWGTSIRQSFSSKYSKVTFFKKEIGLFLKKRQTLLCASNRKRGAVTVWE